jgi:hypothetical protein
MTIAQKLAVLDAAVMFFTSACPVCWFMRISGYETHTISMCPNTQVLFETRYTYWHNSITVPGDCCDLCTMLHARVDSEVCLLRMAYLPHLIRLHSGFMLSAAVTALFRTSCIPWFICSPYHHAPWLWVVGSGAGGRKMFKFDCKVGILTRCSTFTMCLLMRSYTKWKTTSRGCK